MGSSGSGRFTDYPGSGSGSGAGAGAGDGDVPGYEDQCMLAITIALEDIEQSPYFQEHDSVPAVGTEVRVVMGPRIAAETSGGVIIGNLPTQYNYLARCIQAGFSYEGFVQDSSNGPPLAEISVDFGVTAPTT